MGSREIERRERVAQAARERLAATLAEIQQRLAPDTLARNAWDTVRERGRDMAGEALLGARRRPFTTGAIVAAILLFFARGPLCRWACRSWKRLHKAKPRAPASVGGANEEQPR